MKYEIVKLRECPERKDEAAVWFHEKWGYPLEAYRESMEECLAGGSPVPQWYMAAAEGRIIGGLGVIENDFHDRKECLAGGGPVPQWYMAVAEGRIIRRFMSGMDGSFSAWP